MEKPQLWHFKQQLKSNQYYCIAELIVAWQHKTHCRYTFRSFYITSGLLLWIQDGCFPGYFPTATRKDKSAQIHASTTTIHNYHVVSTIKEDEWGTLPTILTYLEAKPGNKADQLSNWEPLLSQCIARFMFLHDISLAPYTTPVQKEKTGLIRIYFWRCLNV